MNRRSPLFAAIGMALLVILVVFFAILPKTHQVSARRAELAQAQQDEQFLKLQLERLRAARSQLPQVRRRLAKFNQKVPATADLPGLIRLLQNASDASNLEFFSIAPQPPAAVGGQVVIPAAPAAGASPTPSPTESGAIAPVVVTASQASVIPADIVVIGGFFEVDQFLYRIETLPRAAKVMSIVVAPGPDANDLPGQIQVTLTIDVFTTDTTAGPGAAPETPAPPLPGATTPAPGTSPTPSTSPTPTTTGG